MAALVLDTHALVTELRSAGFDDRQAEAVTRVVTTTKEAFDLATKQELREVDATLKRDLREIEANLKRDLRDVEANLKRDLREMELRLEAKISDVKAEILKWMFGVVGLQTLVILGAVLTLVRVVR